MLCAPANSDGDTCATMKKTKNFHAELGLLKDNMKLLELRRGAERRELIYNKQKKAAKGFGLLSIIGSLSARSHSSTTVAILFGAFDVRTGDPGTNRMQCGCQALVQSR